MVITYVEGLETFNQADPGDYVCLGGTKWLDLSPALPCVLSRASMKKPRRVKKFAGGSSLRQGGAIEHMCRNMKKYPYPTNHGFGGGGPTKM